MFRWPDGFARVPDEEWTRAPVEGLAQEYDAVGRHGWYANLDETVAELARHLAPDALVVDYSGGTGLLVERLLAAVGGVGVVDVDSSPKFLALAARKLGRDPRVAFRLIRYLKEEKRLEALDEVLPASLLARGVDALVSANAVHLYHGIGDTFASWARVLRPGAFVHVQSGNIHSPVSPTGAWIIDDTVEAIDAAARHIVRSETRFSRHRPVLDDPARMREHEAFQKRVFLPTRPVGHYVDALRSAGFEVERVWSRPIAADADEWHQFLATYSDAVLGWVGGHEKVEGRAPTQEDLADRLALMRLGLEVMLTGTPGFQATWTYVNARKPA